MCYFKGWRDSRNDRIINDENGKLTSHFLKSCCKTVNAYALKSWQEAMKQIFEKEAIIKKDEQRIVQIKYKSNRF